MLNGSEEDIHHPCLPENFICLSMFGAPAYQVEKRERPRPGLNSRCYLASDLVVSR